MNSSKSRGYKVLKLQETHPEEIGRAGEAATIFRLWSLLSADEGIRDLTVGHRNVI